MSPVTGVLLTWNTLNVTGIALYPGVTKFSECDCSSKGIIHKLRKEKSTVAPISFRTKRLKWGKISKRKLGEGENEDRMWEWEWKGTRHHLTNQNIFTV